MRKPWRVSQAPNRVGQTDRAKPCLILHCVDTVRQACRTPVEISGKRPPTEKKRRKELAFLSIRLILIFSVGNPLTRGDSPTILDVYL